MTNQFPHSMLCLALLALLGVASLRAQEPAPDQPKPDWLLAKPALTRVTFRAGLYGAYARNFHETHASIFTGGGQCGAFSDGSGNGYAGGAFAEMPLLGGFLDLVAGLYYVQRGGAFGQAYTGGLPIRDPNSGEYTTLERRHNYTANLGYLQPEFGLRITPLRDLIPLYITSTAAIGFPLTDPTFVQTEEIISPQGVLYPETNTLEREVGSGSIQDVEQLMTISGAIGYPVPLGLHITAAPEVRYYYPLGDVTLLKNWKVSSLQAGVALRWNFGEVDSLPEPPIPPSEPNAPAKPEPDLPVIALSIQSPANVEVVKTIVTETFPILPYIFFNSTHTHMPGRYKRLSAAQRQAFSEKELPHQSLESYYHLLNIIGSRLTEKQDATIILTGTTDGKEVDGPGAADSLARARAQSVKDYLAGSWNINPERIEVKTSIRPAYPSSMEYFEGAEENRRVEIRASDGGVLEPVLHERFNEYSYKPDQVQLALGASGDTFISSWNLAIKAEDNVIEQQAGEGPPPKTFTWKLSQKNADGIATGITGEGRLITTLGATDKNGRSNRSEASIPATVVQHPFEISRLSLIVFDYDESEISTLNKGMVSSFVARSIAPNSTLKITGSTDRLGELDHNQQLSQARAVNVRNLILAENPNANVTSAEGIGPSRLKYDNDLPEGRYYSRTVTVEVETPIKNVKNE